MNTHCFRLIFSKSLGFLIPVAETARAQRKPGRTAGLLLSVLLAPNGAAADILVDATNPSGTNVISAANGVPVLEISNPNDKGLSHNRFTEFDVQKPGLIFNNSLVNGQSQIGGALLRNPNLQRMATAILSEVTGNKPSSISGTLEVFGGKADLLIASPNGITLNGVTTLNTSALTLSTGQVKNARSGLQFIVDYKSGQVIIGADGVNTEGLSYFDIVARSVQLQGKLGSDALKTDLQIIAGQGTYDATTGAFTATPGAQGSGVAIAGSAAGAMHGRYINLISSDSGAGVRQGGLILAAKDIAISADGDIQLTTTTSKGQVQIAAMGSVTNTGALEADTTAIKALNVLNQKGATLSGSNGLSISAQKIVSNNGGKLVGKIIGVKADTIRNSDAGQILGTDIGLSAVTSFTHDGKASIVAGKNLSIDTKRFNATDGDLLAGEGLSVAAESYQNSANLRSKKDASLTLKNGRNLVIDKAFKGPQADGLLLLSAADVTITDELNSAGSVLIDATGNVRNQGTVIVGKTLGITAKGLIDNQAGKLIWAGENLSLEAGTQLLNGLNSQLLAMGDMSLSAGEKVQNNTGRIEAQKNLWIDTPLLENLSQSTGGLKRTGLAQEDAWYGEAYGSWGLTQYFRTIIGLPVYGSDLIVQQAVIKAGGDLQLNADKSKDATAKVRNLGGLIAATGDLVVKGDLENLGVSATQSLMDLLKGSDGITQWSVGGDLVDDESPKRGSLYDLLERTFGSDSSDQWVNSLKLVKTPEVNQVLSAVLGADWKGLNQKQLQPRWAAFKTSNKTQPYYADQQAEISAGGVFVHSDGAFTNGDGSNAGAQRPITVQVGSETVQTLDGELDAQFNAKRADADKALNDLLDNPLFTRNQSGDAFGRIKPLYETRAKYLDQSQFFGSDYFLKKIGYDPQKTVSVLGDAYFDNQLIVQSVEQRVGDFFAQTQRISGTDLAKQLLDNGAALALKVGLTLGQPLTDSQVAGLDKDVVWYENREVDGQLVLAPRVYLSQKTLAARDKDSNSSARVVADSVLIDANAVNNLNGTVRGNTDAFVYSKTDINNVSTGGAQAGFFGGQAGQLVIAAEGLVKSQGGIMSGFDQTVVGGKGISSSATTGYDRSGYLVVRDNGILGTALSADTPKPQTSTENQTSSEKAPSSLAAPDVRALFKERLAAGPVDTSQGSSLNLISGGDITLTSAITQSDNVSLQTSGNLNLNDLHEARSAFDSVSQSGFLSSVHITEMASSANSVGNTVNAKNLQIKTGGNLNITGGEINAQNSAIEVGGNSTIAAAKDLAFHEKTVKTTQLVIGGGVGAAGYEVTGSWGTAADVDTHLASPFDGESASIGSTAPTSVRGDLYAGRGAATQALASSGSGARSGANKGRGSTSGANVKIGMETVTTTDMSESTTYRNAQLNLGNGSIKVANTLDIGGADINAGYQLSPEDRAKMTPDQRKAVTDGLPTLAITAGDIKTSKFENVEKTKHTRDELFIGVTSEVHSSAVDIATQVANLAYKAVGTDAVKDPNAPAGSSKTLATEDRKMDVDPTLTALAAVGMVTQAAFGEVAGQSTTIGIKHTEQKSDSTTRSENINQLGGNISLTSTKGNIELNGVNLQGGKVGIKSAGNLTQRAAKSSTVSHDETNTQSVGLTTSIGVSPTGVGMGVSFGADGSGDKTTTTGTSYTNGLISGTEVSIETKGDHNLIGSNIKGNQVAVKVGGNQTITSVQDTSNMEHERNNWSASAGVAITTNGLVQGTGSASASFGKDFDRSKLVAEQAGISGDKLDLNVAGNLNLTGAHITSGKGQGNVQVGGKINAQTLKDSREKDGGYAGGGGGISKNGLASVTLEFGRVDQVHYSANNAATIDVGDPSKVIAAKGISGALNTSADKQLNVIQNKRVAGTDVKIEISPGDASEIKAGIKGLLIRKAGGGNRVASAPIGGGYTDVPKQKTAPPADAPRAVPNVYAELPKAKPAIDAIAPVLAKNNSPSTLESEVNNLLLQRGLKTDVKGYDTPIRVDEQGHKQPTHVDAEEALANPKKMWLERAAKQSSDRQGADEGAGSASPPTSPARSQQVASADPQPGPSKRSAQEAQLSPPDPGAKKAAWDESAINLEQAIAGLRSKTLELEQQASPKRAQDSDLTADDRGPSSPQTGVAGSLPPKEAPFSFSGLDKRDQLVFSDFDTAELAVLEATRRQIQGQREAKQSEASQLARDTANQKRLAGYASETREQRLAREMRQFESNNPQPIEETADWKYLQELRAFQREQEEEEKKDPFLNPDQQHLRLKVQDAVEEKRLAKALERQERASKAKDIAPRVARNKPTFNQHVIINTDPNDAVVTRAVERLAAKNSDKSVVLKASPDGTTTTVQGELKIGGSTKFEVVGHSDGERVGPLDYIQISDLVQKVAADYQTAPDRVNLVACGTRCPQGPGLINKVSSSLLAGGNTATWVKGYPTAIGVSEQGHKVPVAPGAPDALGKTDPVQPPTTTAQNTAQQAPPESLKARLLRQAAQDGMLGAEPTPPPPPARQPEPSTSPAKSPAQTVAPQAAGETDPSLPLGKRTAEQAGLDSNERIHSMLASIQQQLSMVTGWMPPAGSVDGPPPVAPVDNRLLPALLRASAPFVPPPGPAAATAPQPVRAPLPPASRPLPDRPVRVDSGHEKALPVARVTGQQRSPTSQDSDASRAPSSGHTSQVGVVLLDPPAAKQAVWAADFAMIPLGKTVVDISKDTDLADTLRRYGPVKGLLVDWVLKGNDIADTNGAFQHAMARLPAGSSPGGLGRTLEVMQEVQAGGISDAGRATDEHWRSLDEPYHTRLLVPTIARKHNVSTPALRAFIDNRRSLYELFHPRTGFDEAGMRSEPMTLPPVRAAAVPQPSTQGPPPVGGAAVGIDRFPIAGPGRAPGKGTDSAANALSKKLLLDWIRQTGNLDDTDALVTYVKEQGGDVSAVKKRVVAIQRLLGKDANPIAKATVELFKNRGKEGPYYKQVVADQFGVLSNSISVNLARYQDFLELLTPTLERRLADPAPRPTDAVADNRKPPKMTVNKQRALEWLQLSGGVDNQLGLDAFVEQRGGNIGAVTNVFRSLRDYVHNSADRSIQAAVDLHVQRVAADKSPLLRTPTSEMVASKYGVSTSSLNSTMRKFRPFIDVLEPMRVARLNGLKTVPAAAVATDNSGGNSRGEPDVPKSPAPAADSFVDINNPPRISLEPREDSNSPRAASGGEAAIDVDTLADDGFRTHIKSEPQDSPEPAAPPQNQPDYLDVNEMGVGDARPWLKTEPDSPENVAVVPSPVEPDAPVKEEVPVVRHSINNRVPILQGENGENIVLAALQPPRKNRQTGNLAELVRRQKLVLGTETELAMDKQVGSPAEKRDLKARIAETARELVLMPGDDLANYVEHWMEIDPDVPNKGRGVKAAREIPAYTVVAPYAGKLISGEQNIQNEWKKLGMHFEGYLFGTKSASKVISAFGDGVGNISSLINNGDTPADNNLTVIKLGTKLIYFMATRPIKAGEPLQYDYGPDYNTTGWATNPMQVGDSSDESDSEPTTP